MIIAACWWTVSTDLLRTDGAIGMPEARWVRHVDVTVAKGGAAYLGRHSLGQRRAADGAEGVHVEIYRDARGNWFARNVAQYRRVEVTYDATAAATPDYLSGGGALRRWRLQVGDEINVLGTTLTVSEIPDRARAVVLSVDFSGTSTSFHIDHTAGFEARVTPENPAGTHWIGAMDCKLPSPGGSWAIGDVLDEVSSAATRDARRTFGTLAIWMGLEARPRNRPLVRIGGRVGCLNQIPFPGTPASALALEYHAGELFLINSGVTDNAVQIRRSGGAWMDFSALAWPLDGAAKAMAVGTRPARATDIILGRTRYELSISQSGETLTLTPVGNKHLFFEVPSVRQAPRGAPEDNVFSLAYLVCITGQSANPDCAAQDWGMTRDANIETHLTRSSAWDAETIRFMNLMSHPIPVNHPHAAIAQRLQTFVTYALKVGALVGAVVISLGLSLSGLVTGERRQTIRDRGATKGKKSSLLLRTLGRLHWRLMLSAATCGLTAGVVAFTWASQTYLPWIDRFDLAALTMLCWTAATVAVFAVDNWRTRLGLYWAALTVLIALGSVTLQALASGAGRTNWQGFDLNHQLTLHAVFLGVVAFCSFRLRLFLRATHWLVLSRRQSLAFDARPAKRICRWGGVMASLVLLLAGWQLGIDVYWLLLTVGCAFIFLILSGPLIGGVRFMLQRVGWLASVYGFLKPSVLHGVITRGQRAWAFGRLAFLLLTIGAAYWLTQSQAPMAWPLAVGGLGVAIFFYWDLFLGPAFWRVIALMAALFLFVASGLFGSEEGFGGIQPVEGAKFLFVMLMSAAIVRFDIARQSARSQTARNLSFFFLGFVFLGLYYVVLFGIAPILRSDFSPVLVIGCTGIALAVVGAALLYRVGRTRRARVRDGTLAAPSNRNWRWPRLDWKHWAGFFGRVVLGWMPRVIQGLAIVLVLAGLWVVTDKYETVGNEHDTSAAFDFSTIERRIAIHIDHELHPEWASQLHDSWRALARAEVSDWGGYLWHELSNAQIQAPVPSVLTDVAPARTMALPAVQDDFILAFLVSRFGNGAAMVLFAVQVLVTWIVIDAALSVGRGRSDTSRDRETRHFFALLAFGSALLLVLHWAISWMNVLGLGPIMGQPMSWISYARSHILLMCLPALLAALTVIRLTGEPDRSLLRGVRIPPP